MSDTYPRPRRLVDVAQAIVDGYQPALWADGLVVGPIERVRFLDYPQAEYLAGGVWRQASAFDLIEVI
jgi:hypothetical protein